MVSAGTGRSRHSYLGMASFVLSLFPAAFLGGAYVLAVLLVSMQPPGADEAPYAFGMAALVVVTTLAELAALGAGIAGAVQRRHKRLFALLGVACSVAVLATIHTQVGLGDLASGVIAVFAEPQPKVHSVSPKN